ncbi:DUF4352 domain-containing protein [Streptococcus sp. X16XC17]|uniref:DUF4352 domain-containing protein n=1 Tax=unclassified Streptococcus TaxID=2608887 RepID=UPI00066FD0EA|nr:MULTISPECIES: DUF4352 domain-containing protein [unclassified Streptococcus]TCD45574.1 DUF4352 domain-containing protein [Streptococcus sp. X16XC17]
MLLKDFVIEDGQVFYRKKPLHKQPLFWTSIVGLVLTIILGVVCFSLFVSLGFNKSKDYWGAMDESGMYDELDKGYSEDLSTYAQYELGQSAQMDDTLEVTVTSIEKDNSIELVDDSSSQAVVVEAKVENISDQDFYFDEYDFSLYNSEEVYQGMDFRTYDVNISEKIEPGQSIDVKLIFAGDQGDRYTVVFGDGSWSQYFSDSI